MWANGQRLERHEVEPWVAEAYAFPHFKASVTEREEPQHNWVRVTVTVTGPNAEPIVHPIEPDRRACYQSMRAIPGMAQIESDWVE